MVTVQDVRKHFNLPPLLAEALMLLISKSLVTLTDLEGGDMPLTSDGVVAMHRLRRRMANYDLVIKSQKQLGYWMERDTRERVSQLVLEAIDN